jgi:hypothetical protein
MSTAPRIVANSLVHSALAARVYGLSANARMLLLTVIHANGCHARVETICLIRLFECVDVMANSNFGRGKSDCGSHVDD